ncbi:MAG: hypothetical protein ACLR06_11755 [Christensenellaceae bacterium]
MKNYSASISLRASSPKRIPWNSATARFECDVTQLYPGSHLDEEGYLITAKGEKLDLTDTEVNVEVGLHDITMSDDPEAGGARGNIISLIYKSEYYRYIVRTENEEDYVLACEDLWNETITSA